MPVPTQIPSTYRRAPLVKTLDPVAFSMSRAGFDDISEKGLNLLSTGSIGQLALRYQSLLNIAARRVGIASRNASFRSVHDEIVRIGYELSSGSRSSLIMRNKMESATIALSEAEPIFRSLKIAAREEARKDVLAARQAVTSQVRNSSVREELLAIIDEVSRSTRFG